MKNESCWSGSVAVNELGDRLSALRLMSEPAQRAIEASLVRYGQLSPVICSREATALAVVDGFKRLRAAVRLGWSELQVMVHDSADAGAPQVLLWQSNQGSGLTDLEQAWLVRSLYREENLTQSQIAHLFARHKSWVSRRLMLAEGLSEAVEAQLRLGLLSSTLAREVLRLPRGNQEACAKVMTRRGLSTRQASKLVDELLLAPDEATQQQWLEDKLESCRFEPESVPLKSKRQLTPGEVLLSEVASLKRSSTRLHARLLQRPLVSLSEQARSLAVGNLKELRSGLVSLCKTIEQLDEPRAQVKHAGTP
ncbi:MAG: ParB/RepB/Spo0J family partition protein [Candidatus Krumholzibacteriia bacterium]